VTEGGFGAVSVVARYDGIDLVSNDTNGGDLETIILGVDWWPTDYTRASLNWYRSDAMLGSSGSGLGTDFIALQTVGIPDEKVEGFMVRLQFDF
jgi:phosphate-selective porin